MLGFFKVCTQVSEPCLEMTLLLQQELLLYRSQSVLAQPCSTSLKSAVDTGDVCLSLSINSTTAMSPVNATRLVQLANVAIDAQENALDCRVDSASLAQHDVSDGIKSEDDAGQSCDAVAGSLVTDGQLSRGKVVTHLIFWECSVGQKQHPSVTAITLSTSFHNFWQTKKRFRVQSTFQIHPPKLSFTVY